MALHLVSLTCRYGQQLALDGVTVHVQKGDCYGFLGHNGAGKTTAMRIALGLQRPTAGHVIVDGFDAASHPAEARARLGGLVETAGFHAGLSGSANLVLLARLQGLSRSAARSEAGRVLEAVGLDYVGAKPVGAFSQGMRQRLGIAQALLGRPPIVLLDEPTNGLDPEGIQEIRRLLHHLTRDEGTTVLLSSHQLHEVSGLCTRIGILRNGRLLLEEATEALLTGDRHELRAPDVAAARAALDSLGVSATATTDETLLVEPGRLPPEELLWQLMAAGVHVSSFTPRPPTLEEIYLRLTREGTGVADLPDVPPASSAAPAGRAAPAAPVWRMLRYEVSRWSARAAVPLLLTVPALAGTAALLFRRAEAAGFAADVEAGRTFSTTDVTAFEGVGVALGAGLPVAAYVLAGLASQSIAGERARGTLRNVVLRPLRRAHVAIGKSLAALLAGGVAYLLLALAAVGVAALAFEFADVAEILPNGERYTLIPAAELWPRLWSTLLGPLPALAAYAGLGLAAGAVARTSVGALSLALFGVAALDLARAPLRGFDAEAWAPSAYLPSPLGDTSIVGHYVELTRGVSNTSFAFADTAVTTPLLWAAAGFLAGSLLLARRAVR